MSTAPRMIRFCNECSKKFSGTSNDAVDNKVVKHFQEEHPLKPERCYDLIGKSWLLGYDSAVVAFLNTKTKLEEMEGLYKKEAAIRNTLATKLNAIIMVLENKQEFRA